MGSSDEEESTVIGEINTDTAPDETAESKPYKYQDPMDKRHPSVKPEVVKRTPAAEAKLQLIREMMGQGNQKKFNADLAKIKEEREKSS